jgi:hypothetical protein
MHEIIHLYTNEARNSTSDSEIGSIDNSYFCSSGLGASNKTYICPGKISTAHNNDIRSSGVQVGLFRSEAGGK